MILRIFSVHRGDENAKLAFSNSSGLESVWDQLCFRDGAVWTVGLTVEIKLHFQIPPAYCERGLNGAFEGHLPSWY